MKVACVVLAFAAAVVLAQDPTPPRPEIAEDFYAEVRSEFHDHDTHAFGEGRWALNSTAGKGIEDNTYYIEGRILPLKVYSLQRFDIHEAFDIEGEHCQMRVVNGTIPPVWAWVKEANYTGKDKFHHLELDFWEADFGGVHLRVGVLAPDYNTPVIFNRYSRDHETNYEIHDWRPNVHIDEKYFNIPHECHDSEEAVKPAAPVAAPAQPKIAADFYAEFQFEAESQHGQEEGEGRMASDGVEGKYREELMTHAEGHHEHEAQYLIRWDLKKAFEFTRDNDTACHNRAITQKPLPPFSWVSGATYVGKRTPPHIGEVDVWERVVGGVNMTVGVLDSNPNEPVFMSRSQHGSREAFFIHHFDATKPNETIFEVPPACQQWHINLDFLSKN